MKPRRGQPPIEFLADHWLNPAGNGTTTDLAKARAWSDSSGPRHFFRLHPELRKRFVSYRIDGAL